MKKLTIPILILVGAVAACGCKPEPTVDPLAKERVQVNKTVPDHFGKVADRPDTTPFTGK